MDSSTPVRGIKVVPDPETLGRIQGTPGLSTRWGNATFQRQAVRTDDVENQWGWFIWNDPPGGGNNGACKQGGADDVESHQDLDFETGNVIAPSAEAVEDHCLIPGRYTVILTNARGSALRSRVIDFVSAFEEPDPVAGTNVVVENLSLVDTEFADNVVHFDTGIAPFAAITPSVADPAPGFVEETAFRFDASATTTTWNREDRGRVSVSYLYDGVSGSATVSVTAAVDAADSVSNSFPTQVSQGQFYAVSVRMTNTGNTSWSSGDGYTVRRVSGPQFSPASVGLGLIVVIPTETESIPFTLYTEAIPGDYTVQYRMDHDGTLFGDANGSVITVSSDPCTKNCTLAAVRHPGPVPGGSVGSMRAPLYAPQGDVIQRLEVVDYALRQVTGDGQEARIQYYGALAEPWAVDVTIAIEAPPGSVVPGLARKNVLVAGYEVVVEPGGPGVTLVHLRRLSPAAALPAGEMLLLDIPLNAPVAQRLPEKLPRVEVTVSK